MAEKHRSKPPGSCKEGPAHGGAWGLVNVLAHAVDHLVQLAGDARIFCNPAGEGVGDAVEEAVSCLLPPVEGGLMPLLVNVGDPLHPDHAVAPQLHDGVVSLVLQEKSKQADLLSGRAAETG